MKISFCFGNGESRHGIDVDYLNEYGPIYGCNAIYRDWHVDNLVSCDRKVIKEIIDAGEHQQTNLHVPARWRRTYQKYPEVQYLPTEAMGQDAQEWAAGTWALYLACEHKANIVVMLGYDLWARDGRLNNLYKDSAGYPKSFEKPIDPIHWQQQISQIMQNYSDTQFVQVQADDWVVPESWAECPNFSLDSRQNLFAILENLDRF